MRAAFGRVMTSVIPDKQFQHGQSWKGNNVHELAGGDFHAQTVSERIVEPDHAHYRVVVGRPGNESLGVRQASKRDNINNDAMNLSARNLCAMAGWRSKSLAVRASQNFENPAHEPTKIPISTSIVRRSLLMSRTCSRSMSRAMAPTRTGQGVIKSRFGRS